MNILFLGPSISYGGAEKYTITIAQACREKKYSCKFLYEKTDANGKLFNNCSQNSFSITPLQIGDSYAKPEYRKKSFRIKRNIRLSIYLILKRPNVAVVSLPSIQHGGYILFLLSFFRIPALIVFQYVQDVYNFGELDKKKYQKAKSVKQKWIAVSENNKKLISKSFSIDEDSLLQINNGAKFEEHTRRTQEKYSTSRATILDRHKINSNTVLFCTIAALREQKGYIYLLESIPEVIRNHENTHWLIVGEGGLFSELNRIVDELGIKDYVTFCGYRSDVSVYLDACDYFVFPSLYEGQPFALLEAAAHGIPCITTDASGISEIFEHRNSALMCKIKDSEMLSSFQIEAIRSPELMKKLAHNAIKKLPEFSEEKMVSQTLGAIEKLLHDC